MNSMIFHSLVNRLIISPFIDNVQADYEKRTMKFDVKIPLFASRPNLPPMMDNMVGRMMENYGPDNLKHYWKGYVHMLLMPYGNTLEMDLKYDEKKNPKLIKFQIKS